MPSVRPGPIVRCTLALTVTAAIAAGESGVGSALAARTSRGTWLRPRGLSLPDASLFHHHHRLSAAGWAERTLFTVNTTGDLSDSSERNDGSQGCEVGCLGT